MKTSKCFLAIFISVIFISVAVGATLEVGSGKPYGSIQAAINAANAAVPDNVLVYPGTYIENINFNGKNIAVVSKSGPYVTIINGNGVGRTVTFANGENSNAVLKGFTIKNGYSASIGGGIICYGISGVSYTSPSILGNIIRDNSSATDGGGISCYISQASLINNLIYNNHASGRGGGIHCQNYGNCTISNNTISGNSASISGGGINVDDTANPILRNTILYGNSAGSGSQVNLRDTDCDPYFYYCDVQGGTAAFAGSGSGANYDTSRYQNNIDAAPLFVGGGDCHLQSGSPCIDAGDNNSVPGGVTTDLDGTPRFIDDPCTIDTGNGTPPIVDIGAYEILSIGELHNAALDYLLANDPIDSNTILITLEEYQSVIGVLKDYLVDVGFDSNDVNTVADSLMNRESDMGMFYLRDMAIYYGAPVVSDQIPTYQTQYLVEQGMITKAVAEKIDKVAAMTMDGNDPNFILAYVQSLPGMEWTADEAKDIAVFVDVYLSSQYYWRADWVEIALASGMGALEGGAIGEPLGPWGIGLGAVLGGARDDYREWKRQQKEVQSVAPKPEVTFDCIYHRVTGIGNSGLDISGRKLIVYNTKTTGEFGVKADVRGSTRWDCLADNPDPCDMLPIGASLKVVFNAVDINNKDPAPDGFAIMRETKDVNDWWRLDVNIVGVTSYTLEAYNNGVLVYQEPNITGTGYISMGKGKPKDPNEPRRDWHIHIDSSGLDFDCDWTWPCSRECTYISRTGYGPITIDRLSVKPIGFSLPITSMCAVTVKAMGMPSYGIIEELTQSNIPGDINRDGYVNFSDFAVLAGNWLTEGEVWPEWDAP
jgi:parallel beta-helix repeat protein